MKRTALGKLLDDKKAKIWIRRVAEKSSVLARGRRARSFSGGGAGRRPPSPRLLGGRDAGDNRREEADDDCPEG